MVYASSSQMENKIPGSHRFFKIMKPEYMSKLPLPKAFCRKLDGQHSEVAFITTCKGKWEVTVKKSSDLLSFAGGWDIFAREHDLRLGNFIVFKHIGSMHFTATVFDLTACEKDFSADLTNKKNGTHRVDGSEMKHPKKGKPSETNASDYKGRSHFTAVIKVHSVDHSFTCKMENKVPGSQHFYKIMRPEYNTQLPLPQAFCEKLNGQHLEVATITSCKGTWEVKIEKGSSKLISFGRGWDVFAHEHEMSVGNFILFEYCGRMHFTVTIFDLTACGKEFPVNSRNRSDKIIGEESTNTSTFDSSHFTTEITSYDVRHCFGSMYIPMAFSKAHGLFRTRSIILRDSTGEEWTVEVRQYSRQRVVMRKGWSDFCISKQVKIGDSCTFRFKESLDRYEVALLDVCIFRV